MIFLISASSSLRSLLHDLLIASSCSQSLLTQLSSAFLTLQHSSTPSGLVAYLLEKEKNGGAQHTEDKLVVFSYPITRINILHCFACFYQQIETCDIKISSLRFHPFTIKLVDITSYHLRAEIKVLIFFYYVIAHSLFTFPQFKSPNKLPFVGPMNLQFLFFLL